jgi:hypothetical protein
MRNQYCPIISRIVTIGYSKAFRNSVWKTSQVPGKWGFLERSHAQDLEDFGEAAVDLQLPLEDGRQHVDADGDPHLRLHGVDGAAVERLDPQVLFDPFENLIRLEEAFYSPTTPTELCDRECRKVEVVGQEHESPLVFVVVERNAAQRSRIEMRCRGTLEYDRPIAAQTGRLVDHTGLATAAIAPTEKAQDTGRSSSSPRHMRHVSVRRRSRPGRTTLVRDE